MPSPDNLEISRRTFVFGGAATLVGAVLLGRFAPDLGASADGGPGATPTPVGKGGPEATPTPQAGKGGKGKSEEETEGKGGQVERKGKLGVTDIPFSTKEWGPFSQQVAREQGILTADAPNGFVAWYVESYGGDALIWEKANLGSLPGIVLGKVWKGWCQGPANAGALKFKRPEDDPGKSFGGVSIQRLREQGLGYLNRSDMAAPGMKMERGTAVPNLDQLRDEIVKNRRYGVVELNLDTEEGLWFRTAFDVSEDDKFIRVTNLGQAPFWAPIESVRWFHFPRYFKDPKRLGMDNQARMNTMSSVREREVSFLRNPHIDQEKAFALIYPGVRIPDTVTGKDSFPQ